jgi:hypothetical protein
VRRAEIAGVPFHQGEIGAGLVEVAVKFRHLAAVRRHALLRDEFDLVALQNERLFGIDRRGIGRARHHGGQE